MSVAANNLPYWHGHAHTSVVRVGQVRRLCTFTRGGMKQSLDIGVLDCSLVCYTESIINT